MNSPSDISDDRDVRSVENSGLHVSDEAWHSLPCSSKLHDRPIAGNDTVLDRNGGSFVMKSEPISNDDLEPDRILTTDNKVTVKQEVHELLPDSELANNNHQEEVADDLSVFDCDSLSEYEVSDSDDSDKVFDGFCESETELVVLNSDDSIDRESFEGFKNESITEPICKSEITGRLPNALVESAVLENGCITPDPVDDLTISLTGNGSPTTETRLPLPTTCEECTFEGFHVGDVENANKDMNTSKFKSQYLFNKIIPELNNLQSKNEAQLSPKQSMPKKAGVSPKPARTVSKSDGEMEEYIGPFCHEVGCTVSWLESGLQKNVKVNNGLVVELTEFAKKIAWERKYVGEWILRLRGFASHTVEVSEEDQQKIHMVNKRRKAISVTFSGKYLLKPKLAAFDKEIFTLPSESSASNKKQIEIKEWHTSTSEKIHDTSRVLFAKKESTYPKSEVEHNFNSSSFISKSATIVQSLPLPCHNSNEVQQLHQETVKVPLPSLVDDNSDSECGMVIDEAAYSNGEADDPESTEKRDGSENSPWVSSQKSCNDVEHIVSTQNSNAFPEALGTTSSKNNTSVGVSGHLKSSMRSLVSSPSESVKSNNELLASKKVDFSKSSFGQHIAFASKKGKGDFAGKNVQYPIFEIRDNAIGPFCIRESLNVETLNCPSQKVAVTNGMVIELYIFFKERGATLTSLVYKLHQLLSVPINVTMMQSDMAKIQEVVNIELHKKTDYYLEKEFTFGIFQRNPNTAASSGTYSAAHYKQDECIKNIADVTMLKPPASNQGLGGGGSTNVMSIKSTQVSHKTVTRTENFNVSGNSATTPLHSSNSNESHTSLSKPTHETGHSFSLLKTQSQVSKKYDIKKIDAKSVDSDEAIVQELNQCKGKRGCITRGDIVKLYYNWLQLKNKDKDSVFVIDLLSEVEELMISREVNVIRIPVGTLMSSSVRLFEEYQRFRLSSQEDALAYLEDDWLEDIQYLVSISKSRRPAVEDQPVVFKNSKPKSKAVTSKDSNPAAVAGETFRNVSENVEQPVFDKPNKSVNASSDELKRKKTATDNEDKSPKKAKLASADKSQVKNIDGFSDQSSIYPPEPVIDLTEFASLSFSSKIEILLSCRLSSISEGEPVYEYLAQWRNKENNEITNTWMAETDLPTACILVTNFWENNPFRILKVDKIFQHRKAKMAKSLVEYLVLWYKYNSQSWIREDHLPQQSESVVQSYLLTSDLSAHSQEEQLEGVENLNKVDPKTDKLKVSINPQKVSEDSVRSIFHLDETKTNHETETCYTSTEHPVTNGTIVNVGASSVMPEEISHCSATRELLSNEAEHSKEQIQACHSSDQQTITHEKGKATKHDAPSANRLGLAENSLRMDGKSLFGETETTMDCSKEVFDSEEFCYDTVTELDPDCTSAFPNAMPNSLSYNKISMEIDARSTKNSVPSSSDDNADSTSSSPSLLALTDDKENSASDSGNIQKSVKRKYLQTMKRKPRDELMTEDEKSSEITHFKKVPLSAVFGEKSKYKTLTEAIIQHVNPNYPSGNLTGIEVHSFLKTGKHKNAIVTKGRILAIYDEWRVLRKRSNIDLSEDNVATLRNRIKGVLESRNYEYEYDDCLLGVCYSLYLSRLKLETVSDILAFNNTDCINTFKHFKQKHSSLLTDFYSLPNPEERNSEVSSTTDFSVSETATGSSSLVEAEKSLSGKISALSQASVDKDILSNVIDKLKQGISDIAKSFESQPNNSAEVKKELGGMKQAVTILEKGLSSNEKDVDKLQAQVDKEKALLSLKSSGMKDNDIVDLLKLVSQSLPEESQ